MSFKDLSIYLLDEIGTRSKHGEGGKVSLQSSVHTKGTCLLIHATEKEQVLDELLFFE